MPQPYNRTRLSISAVNRMKIKSLIRNRTVTKCFLFDEKALLIFYRYVQWYHLIFQNFDYKCLISLDLSVW